MAKVHLFVSDPRRWRSRLRTAASSFQSSNRLQPYHLYSNVDYQQLPVDFVSPFSRTTVACQSGPDVGLVDIARRQSETPFIQSPSRTHTFAFREGHLESKQHDTRRRSMRLATAQRTTRLRPLDISLRSQSLHRSSQW